MGFDNLQSDLPALKRLYGILQNNGNVLQETANANLDEKSRLMLKKLLDDATEHAFQSHAKIMAGPSTSSLILQSEKSKEEPKFESFDLLKTHPSKKDTQAGIRNQCEGPNCYPIALGERDESRSQQRTNADPPEKLKMHHTQSRRELKGCPICHSSNPKCQSSPTEKVSLDKKTPLSKKDHYHRHSPRSHKRHHRRIHDRLHVCSSEIRPEKQLPSKETECSITRIFENPCFIKLQSDPTVSPGPCVRSEHPSMEFRPKLVDHTPSNKKKLNVSKAAAAAIQRIDDHIPAQGMLSQMENQRSACQMLPQQPYSVTKLGADGMPNQTTESKVQRREITSHKSGPSDSVRINVQSNKPVVSGHDFPGPMLTIDRPVHRSVAPHEKYQMLHQEIIKTDADGNYLPGPNCRTRRTTVLTRQTLGRTRSKNGEEIKSERQVQTHKVRLLGKDLSHRITDKVTEAHYSKIFAGPRRATEITADSSEQKRRDERRANPAVEAQNKVERAMAHWTKAAVGPTIEKLRAKPPVGSLQLRNPKESRTYAPELKVGGTNNREPNGTTAMQSKGDGKISSVKRPAFMTEMAGPSMKKLSDDLKPLKVKQVAHDKDQDAPRPNKSKAGQTKECGSSHAGGMLILSEDTLWEELDLRRQMMSRMPLTNQSTKRMQEPKTLAKQGRKVGPILENQPSSRRGRRGKTTGVENSRQKLVLPLHTAARRVPSRTSTSYTTESTYDSAASETSLSSSTPSQQTTSSGSEDDDLRDRMLTPRTLRRKSLPRRMLTHHARRTSREKVLPRWTTHVRDPEEVEEPPSPRWRLSRYAAASGRPAATRSDPKKKPGKLRRFKDKLGIIFHHHHHHHHHHGHEDSQDDSPSDDHHRRSIWKPFGKTPRHNGKEGGGQLGAEEVYGERVAEASAKHAIIRAPRRHNHQQGHLHALLERLLRHVWHSKEEGEKAGADRRRMGKDGSDARESRKSNKKLKWWQGSHKRRGGVKLATRKKKPPLLLGFHRAQKKQQ